jgi:hypothetical protein
MKTQVLLAKSIWIINMRAINPKGLNLYRVIVPKLKEWYGFEEPKEFDEQKGVKFTGGEVALSENSRDKIGVALTIYNDGTVVETTTSTDDADLFTDHVATRLAKEGYIQYSPGLVRKRQYSSEIEAYPDSNLLLLSKLEPFCRALTEAIYPSQPGAFVTPSSLLFDADPTSPGKQIPFKFERRLGVPFSENLYYSHAPLRTQQHIEMLSLLESALTQ